MYLWYFIQQWKSLPNPQQFTTYLSLKNPDPHLASDLVECGSDSTTNVNDNRAVEIQCVRPRRSLFVILEEGPWALKVCDFTVYSFLSDYLL